MYNGCLTTVFIVFLILKLCGFINWSWWWVLSPVWVPLSIFIFGVCVVLIFDLIKSYKDGKR